jgi:hypothetical protein
MLSRFQLLFICVLFIVSFMSDVILNDLVRKPLADYHTSIIIKSLYPYFKDKSIIQAGALAGLTIVVAYFCLMVVWNIMGFGNIPTREIVYSAFNTTLFVKLIYELILAFILGYIIDIVIHKLNIFGPSLDNYYNVTGSGFWGGLAFIVAIGVTYGVLRILVRGFV